MRRTSGVAAMAVLGLAGVMQAQTAPTPEQVATRLVQRYAQVLGLSSTVEGEALTIYTAEETAQEPIHTTEREAQKALVTAIAANNAANLATVTTAIGTLKAQSALAKAAADAQVYALLTTEQQAKFLEILSRGDQAGQSGRGGPMQR